MVSAIGVLALRLETSVPEGVKFCIVDSHDGSVLDQRIDLSCLATRIMIQHCLHHHHKTQQLNAFSRGWI